HDDYGLIGIDIFDSKNLTIVRNVINETIEGISLMNAANNTIEATNATSGLYFIDTEGTVVRTVHFYEVIPIDSPRNSIISSEFDRGIIYENPTPENVVQDTFENNTIRGLPIIYLENVKNKVINQSIGQAIIINSFNITLKDLVVKGGRDAIDIFYSESIRVENTTVVDSSRAAVLYGSNSTTFISNRFNGTDEPILLESSPNNVFEKNYLDGLHFSNSPSNTIVENVFNDGISLGGEMDNLFQSTVSGNKIGNTSLLFLQNKSNLNYDNINFGQAIFLNSENIHIQGSDIRGGDAVRIQLWYSSNIKIEDVNITDIDNAGILMVNTQYSSIANIRISGTTTGVRMIDSDYNTINNVNISNMKVYGLYLYSSDHNQIANLSVVEHGLTGLYLERSNGNNITQALLIKNYIGISLFQSNENYIRHSEIALNREIAANIHGENNTIMYNDFVGRGTLAQMNYFHVPHTFAYNYWIDYSGSDDDNDGIGDKPYPIWNDDHTLNITDPYPQMRPYDPSYLLPPPVSFSLSQDEDGAQIFLEWDTDPNYLGPEILQYRIYYKSEFSISYANIANVTGETNSFTYNTSQYDVGTHYSFIVTGVNKNGEGFPSDEQDIVIVDTLAPRIVDKPNSHIFLDEGQYYQLSWTALDAHPGAYWIYWNGQETTTANWHSNQPIFFGFTANPSGNHTVTIQFKDTFGNEINNSVVFTVVGKSGETSRDTHQTSQSGITRTITLDGFPLEITVFVLIILRKQRKKCID
ncbi:MAG: hypothetical protein D6732_11895, partial [Methanobacteriota archaeon]